MLWAAVALGIIYAVVYWLRKRGWNQQRPGERWMLIGYRECLGGEVRLYESNDSEWIVQLVPTNERDGTTAFRYKTEEKARNVYSKIRIR
jgi:hypothetical protein